MKRLFDENDAVTPEGNAYLGLLLDALQPIFEKADSEGFSRRDVTLLALNAAYHESAKIHVRSTLKRVKP